MPTVHLSRNVHRVWVQVIGDNPRTELIQKVNQDNKFEEFESFDIDVEKTDMFKCVILILDKDFVLRVAGVLLNQHNVINWIDAKEKQKTEDEVDIGLATNLKATIINNPTNATSSGLFRCSFNKGRKVQRPPSQDLARRFEYSEYYRPTVSMYGLCEILIPVPFWKERWRAHESLLTNIHFLDYFQNGEVLDVPKLAYCVVGMFGWRTTYTSEKQDMLIQQLLVDYKGDCEDQALEQAKVIHAVLQLEEDDPFLKRFATARFFRSYVNKVFLVSGVANPCLEGDLIGHCWLAVSLKGNTPCHYFGLGLGLAEEGRLAYMEGTTPVSWGWTNKLSDQQEGLKPLVFHTNKFRKADQKELKKLCYLFDATGRWKVIQNMASPFDFVMNRETCTRDENLASFFLASLQGVNLDIRTSAIKRALYEDWTNHCRFLVQFTNDRFYQRLPTGKNEKIEFIDQSMKNYSHLMLVEGRHVLGPYWTTSLTAAIDLETQRNQGSL